MENPRIASRKSEGLKRRDLLLSGTSLLAASALSQAGVATPAQAHNPRDAAAGTAQHRRHHGRRHRLVKHRRLPSGHDVRTTPNLDKHGDRGHALHRLLRGTELHCRPRELHYRRIADPYRNDHGRTGGATVGMPDEAPTIATALKAMGYATGQFGKNHLGDLTAFCRHCMASTNFSAISITSTRWKTLSGTPTRRPEG